MSADNLVGDSYEISLELEDGVHKAWLVNRFDKRIGFFDPKFSRTLSVYAARDFTLKAYLSYVAYTDKDGSSYYWGEMAVICYDPACEEAFGAFCEAVSTRLQEGMRTKLDLGDEAVDHIVSSNGTWIPSKTVPLPSKEKGTVIMKSKRSFSDNVVEQGRSRKVGCYVVSWAFIIIVILLIVVLILRICGVF